ncbi:hypothetical protein OG292_19955 [Streptomyces sp. NBC_01511]|uniref:hypothetical protein n=1 Tax=Streptomyces sp. NBC_01511 TaxID=2903889 RepID=UPI0038640AD5
MTPVESGQIAVELEKMRGAVDTGLARVDGKLGVLVERGQHTEQRLSAAEAAAATLATRVTALERRMWTASGIAAALGAGGGILAAVLGA